MSGKQVRLFLADGTPGGLLTAEIMNWTGHIVAASRSELSALLKRPEAQRTGIYLLVGDDPESPGRDLVYVGEGDNVGKRLLQHHKDESKEFWTRAVLLISKDANLTKAHARYLESRFIALATAAGRSRLHNSTAPTVQALPEADVSDMEEFISQAQIVLPLLGVNGFRPTKVRRELAGTELPSSVLGFDVEPAPGPNGSWILPQTPVFTVRHKKDGVVATAQEVDGEFTVRAGSLARLGWIGTAGSYAKLRQRLEAEGVITPNPNGGTSQFTRDQVFASPSAAAAVVLGRNANGRKVWAVTGSGQTYEAWQTALLGAVEQAIELQTPPDEESN